MSSRIRLAPSLSDTVRRIALILLVAAIVGLGALAIEGPPSRARARNTRKEAPYGPSLPGLVQFLGQTTLLGVGVYAARRWLKVKL